MSADDQALAMRCGEVVKARASGKDAQMTGRELSLLVAMEKNCPPCDQAAFFNIPAVAEEIKTKGTFQDPSNLRMLNDYRAKVESECSGSSVSTKVLYGALAFVAVALVVRLLRQ